MPSARGGEVPGGGEALPVRGPVRGSVRRTAWGAVREPVPTVDRVSPRSTTSTRLREV